jgi:hypothetical protein
VNRIAVILNSKGTKREREKGIMNFYNVKKREAVTVADADCRKVVYKRKTSKGVQERYAVRAQDTDGTNLTKFLNKAAFEKLGCPAAKA